ncbi:unnamed protein product [Protopolystoma xenopodis]|uniref:Uncharacterized protein n=1 Tax=Protopolystoma xenopodis TaxID=117903 RepID=A0A3S4ZWY1_9PLAT|nr:unnamed protein product [Protopolystoma xenopodis]
MCASMHAFDVCLVKATNSPTKVTYGAGPRWCIPVLAATLFVYTLGSAHRGTSNAVAFTSSSALIERLAPFTANLHRPHSTPRLRTLEWPHHEVHMLGLR